MPPGVQDTPTKHEPSIFTVAIVIVSVRRDRRKVQALDLAHQISPASTVTMLAC